MAIHGFVFLKFTKPDHEHHLTSFSKSLSKPAAVHRVSFPDF